MSKVNVSFTVFPHPFRVAAVTSWDDGPKKDVTVGKLLSKYGMKGTFLYTLNWPQWLKELPRNNFQSCSPEDLKTLCSLGHDVGSHTINHPHLSECTEEEIRKEVIESRKIIEDMMGYRIVSFGYPFFDEPISDDMVKVVKEAGYVMARLAMKDDWISFPDYVEGKKSMYKFPFSIPLGMRPKLSPEVDECVNLFNEYYKVDGSVFVTIHHAAWIETDSEWKALEEILQKISAKPDVWYCTLGQLGIYAAELSNSGIEIISDDSEKLIFKILADTKLDENIYNIPLWLKVEGANLNKEAVFVDNARSKAVEKDGAIYLSLSPGTHEVRVNML